MGQGLSDLNSAHLLFGHLILPGSWPIGTLFVKFQTNLHAKCFCEDALWGDPPQLCDLSCRKSHFLSFVCSFVQCSSFEATSFLVFRHVQGRLCSKVVFRRVLATS